MKKFVGFIFCFYGFMTMSLAETVNVVELSTVIDTDIVSYARMTHAGDFISDTPDKQQSDYGLTEKDTFAVDFGDKGILLGQAKCFSDELQRGKTKENDKMGAIGNFCWCKFVSYKKPEYDSVVELISPYWVSTYSGSNEPGYTVDDCYEKSACSLLCATIFVDGFSDEANAENSLFKASMLGLTFAVPGSNTGIISDEKIPGNSVGVGTAISKLNEWIKTMDTSRSKWKDASGNFNGARLASDLTAGVVLGTVGGVVSGVVIKKKQVEKGFDALNCYVGGQKMANWGDEFRIEFHK